MAFSATSLQIASPPNSTVSPQGALDSLHDFMDKRRKQGKPVADFGAFEEELHKRVMGVERELLGEELARGDIDAEAVEVGGVEYRRAVRSIGRYQTAAGEVCVERTLYRRRKDGESGSSFAALDRNLGIIDGRWTPMAAKQGAWLVAQMTPAASEELLERMGNMTPSKSSLERLPKTLQDDWADSKDEVDAELRKFEHVPDNAATVAVSLDGVMAPMRDGNASEKRKAAAASGHLTRGPAGYREVGCGTISFYDADAGLLKTVRMGRMPEHKKATLKDMLSSELGRAFAERPDLRLVAVADGAKDNWSYLKDEVLSLLDDEHLKVAILDFFHATEHINAALGAIYGDGSVKARTKFNNYRGLLLEDPHGVEKVIRSLAHLKKQFPKVDKLAKVLTYLRKHRHMMRYSAYRDEGLPIGSGVIEAACKTLVTQRMKNSGMRWGQEGGQAVLTLRSWAQSDRFDRAWALIAAKYRLQVTTLANVVRLPLGR